MKFRASHLKVNRAAHHIDELNAEFAAYTATAPLKLVWEQIDWIERFESIYPSNSKLVGLVSRIHNPVPEKLAPIIGDVVHNLRSALDIMMTEVVLNHDAGAVTRLLCFPMWEDDSKKKNALSKSQVGRAAPIVQTLVEAWEPFRGGRSRLFALHELWNLDKHRSIIPVMSGAEFSEGMASFLHELKGEQIIDPFPARKQVWDGKLLAASQEESGPPIGTEIPCNFLLGLDGDSEVKGRDLLVELKAQIEIVRAVLISFETFDFPDFAPPPKPGPVRVNGGHWMFPPSMSPDDVDQWIEENLAKGWQP